MAVKVTNEPVAITTWNVCMLHDSFENKTTFFTYKGLADGLEDKLWGMLKCDKPL